MLDHLNKTTQLLKGMYHVSDIDDTVIATLPWAAATFSLENNVLSLIHCNEDFCTLFGMTFHEMMQSFQMKKPYGIFGDKDKSCGIFFQQIEQLEYRVFTCNTSRKDGGDIKIGVSFHAEKHGDVYLICLLAADTNAEFATTFSSTDNLNNKDINTNEADIFDYNVLLDSVVFYYKSGTKTIVRNIRNVQAILDRRSVIYFKDRRKCLDGFRHALTCTLSGSLEARLLYRTKAYHWYRVIYNSEKNKDGQLVRIIGQIDDIHNQKIGAKIFENPEDNLINTQVQDKSGIKDEVFIRTFRYFDVFVNGKAILFHNEKAKELLAILVNRVGGYVCAGEAISKLWEDEPKNDLVLTRLRKVALHLNRTLKEYGIDSILDSKSGKRRIVTEKVTCDYFEYLKGNRDSANFHPSGYLLEYSWAEESISSLLSFPDK